MAMNLHSTLTLLYSVLAGVAVTGGVVLLVAAIRGFPVKVVAGKAPEEKFADAVRFLSRRGSVAIVAGAGTLAATRWPVAALAVALLVFFWDRLFGGAGAERAAMRRVEALASWTESLRDTIAGAVGLEQAIPASTRAAAPALRAPLEGMIDRLRSRMPLADALQFFADDLDDPSADLVIAALILNSRLRGPGLREVLTALAKSSREEVDMRQRVSAQRAATRRSVQIVVAVSCAFVLGISLFNHDFVQPYDDPLGQAVLLVVLALFGAGFFWLRRLSKVETPARFLVRRADPVGGEQ
jgi:Flp pilus assembly protein TadB